MKVNMATAKSKEVQAIKRGECFTLLDEMFIRGATAQAGVQVTNLATGNFSIINAYTKVVPVKAEVIVNG